MGWCAKFTYISYSADRSFTISDPEFENGKLVSGDIDYWNQETN
jgi:hypothetical protein